MNSLTIQKINPNSSSLIALHDFARSKGKQMMTKTDPGICRVAARSGTFSANETLDIGPFALTGRNIIGMDVELR
jgi:hypothetical protein